MNLPRIYITYDYNPETMEPENIKIYRNPPKGKFFFDSKIVSPNVMKEKNLHLIMIHYRDGLQNKHEFYDIVKNLELAKDNVDKYVNSINAYHDKYVTKVSLLELSVNEE
jgi:hypothetical protein